MMTPKVSIVIPVYNGAKTIEKTLISILKQSLTDIEIIVVDDGSTDHTLEVIAAMKNSRIQVVTKKNEGVSSARNAGVKVAKGEYVGFVDADDLVKEDMYEQLYSASSSNIDVVVSGLLIEKDGKFVHKDPFLESNKTYTKEDFKKDILARYLALENLDLLSVVNKIYKRSFLIEKKIVFDENLALEEDGMFNLKVYTSMGSLVQIAYSGYYYLANESSVTRDFIASNLIDKLIQKFNYDYKKRFTLEFSEEQILTFKSSRLIYSISFLLFSLSKTKMKQTKRNGFITQIIQDPTVFYAANHLSNYYEANCSKFEKIIISCIKNKRILAVKGLIFMLSIAHQTGLIQIMRKLN